MFHQVKQQLNKNAMLLAFLMHLLITQECVSFTSFVKRSKTISTRKTELHAMTAPALIIGPMIRRMREENRKKNMPLASADERDREAPGLRIGTGVWKWPPVWPYDPDLFARSGEEITKTSPAAGNPMALLAQASQGVGAADISAGDSVDETKLDVKKYWGETMKDVTTDLEEAAAEKLKSHYAYYLKDGMSVLEFGAAENSYLPEDFKPSQHVGISLSKDLMDKNPSLTDKFVIDIDNVVKEVGIDSDEIRALEEEAEKEDGLFDIILMSNTIDFLTNPREIFKSAWRLCKPGGIMFVAFTTKDAYSSKFDAAQTNQWRNFNDDQHMYVAGSFFQFSASDGWTGLKGFDISPEGANKPDNNNPLAGMLGGSKGPQPMYVVQATKNSVAEIIDAEDPEESFKSRMWIMPTLEERDKQLVAPRIARSFLHYSDTDNEYLLNQIQYLPKIYEILIKMDQFAFPFNLQAQLAADLITDKDFNANDHQLTALKMGLGLRKPSADFWAPIGQYTSAMEPENKVNLLAHLVPRFGSNDPQQEQSLQDFVTGLKPTFQLIKTKCPSLSESDVQTLGTELLASEILKPNITTKEQFALWMQELTEDELLQYYNDRTQIKVLAVAEMNEMKAQRQALVQEREDRMKAMKEQVEAARSERTMVFNEKTGKMEEVKK